MLVKVKQNFMVWTTRNFAFCFDKEPLKNNNKNKQTKNNNKKQNKQQTNKRHES